MKDDGCRLNVILNEVKDPARQAATSLTGSFVISFLRMTCAGKKRPGFFVGATIGRPP